MARVRPAARQVTVADRTTIADRDRRRSAAVPGRIGAPGVHRRETARRPAAALLRIAARGGRRRAAAATPDRSGATNRTGPPGRRPGRAQGPWPRPTPDAGPWPRPASSLPAPDLLGPDEELVAGRRPVEEVFAAGRTAHRLLVVPQRRNALEQLVLHATRLRIPIVEVEGGSLTAIAGFDGHQGVALSWSSRGDSRRSMTSCARARERGEAPFVLVLDSLEDPQNLGTLLRSAEAAGVHGVVFPTRRQAPLSAAAVKASAGATEHLLLCPVDDLPGALADLHTHGLRIAGSEADAPLTARQTDLRGPLAIVVGSEGQGLGPAIRRRCDLFMRIPMRGAIGSLNAAVAGSVLLFEAVAQRDGGCADAGPSSPKPSAARRRRPRPSRARAGSVEPRTARRPGPRARSRPRPTPAPDEDLLPGGPPAARRSPSRGSRERRGPPTLDPSARTALSFPGASGVSCGMSLRVAPT